MKNPTKKIIQVYEILKGGKTVKFDDIVAQIGGKPITTQVYISDLRCFFGAEIEPERVGKKVVGYKLLNSAALASIMVAQVKPQKVAVVKAKPVAKVKTATKVAKTAVVARKIKDDEFDVPTLDADLEISEIGDAELADIASQLGL